MAKIIFNDFKKPETVVKSCSYNDFNYDHLFSFLIAEEVINEDEMKQLKFLNKKELYILQKGIEIGLLAVSKPLNEISSLLFTGKQK